MTVTVDAVVYGRLINARQGALSGVSVSLNVYRVKTPLQVVNLTAVKFKILRKILICFIRIFTQIKIVSLSPAEELISCACRL